MRPGTVPRRRAAGRVDGAQSGGGRAIRTSAAGRSPASGIPLPQRSGGQGKRRAREGA